MPLSEVPFHFDTPKRKRRGMPILLAIVTGLGIGATMLCTTMLVYAGLVVIVQHHDKITPHMPLLIAVLVVASISVIIAFIRAFVNQ